MHSFRFRLSTLFKKYYNKTASQSEMEELYQIMNSISDDELKELIREEWNNLEMTDSFFDKEISEGMLDQILPVKPKSTYNEQEPILDHLINWISRFKKLSVATLILVFLGFGFYVWFKPNHAPQVLVKNSPISKDLPPGGSRATLLLADGREIILDKAKNGIIIKTQNFQILKTENGQLIYQALTSNTNKDVSSDFNKITTPRGGEYKIIMPDGSMVWLNSASTIKFPGVFSGKTRSVELEGEAYFEIAKNAEMPFIVKSKNIEIEVIGTHFNVNTNTGTDVVKTTLLEGSIKIDNGNSSKLLSPGQQAIQIGNEIKVVNDVDVKEQIAWKNGLFQFKDASVEEVMQQAALWYDLEVAFEGDSPEKYLTGKVSRNVNVSEFMNILEYAGVKFKIEQKKITIKSIK